MRTTTIPPGPALLESLRSIGYTVQSAVADVIDNSIAAGASEVEIMLTASGPFEVAVVDNGSGMDLQEALVAMTLAPMSPSGPRGPRDLGRFGLGLKTASLSQCRTLTVVTVKDSVLSALRWSLDHVMRTGQWEIIHLERHDVETLLGWTRLVDRPSGTLVHWGDLDLLEVTEGGTQSDLDRVAVRIRDHVALVFHLFITGDTVGGRVVFRMNGAPIRAIDPFMSTSTKISKSEWEPIDVEGQTVRLRAYTLPYLSRLSPKERGELLRLGPLRDTQGFYVYRGGRLVIWGKWFRVMPRSEMAKLTRVRVDIPNSLDHLWALDVKKSKAEPPPQVSRRLRELAKAMILPGERVQKFRGRKVHQPPNVDFMWDVRVNGDQFSYEINPAHPSIEAFAQHLTEGQRRQFALVLGDIQNTFPVIDAHNRMSGDGVPVIAAEDTHIVDRAVAAWGMVRDQGVDIEDFIHGLAGSDPYCLVPNFEKLLRESLDDDARQ